MPTHCLEIIQDELVEKHTDEEIQALANEIIVHEEHGIFSKGTETIFDTESDKQ